MTRRSARPHDVHSRSTRVRRLAEAGAAGHLLTPHEVKEICEALRSRSGATRTHFHSGFG